MTILLTMPAIAADDTPSTGSTSLQVLSQLLLECYGDSQGFIAYTIPKYSALQPAKLVQ